MERHVRILGTLYVVFGFFGLAIGIIFLAFFGGLAGVAGISATEDPDARIAIPILGAVGFFIFILCAVLSLPGIVAGLGLLKLRPWARIITVVLSALNLMNFPFGTALGAYGLWVLLNNETASLFEAQPLQ